MIAIAFEILSLLVLPVVVNKTTEDRFHGIKQYLREIWWGIAFAYTVIILLRLESEPYLMTIRQGFGSRYPIISYLLVAISGALLFTGYWWFLGKILPVKADGAKPEQGSPAPAPNTQNSRGKNSPNTSINGNNNTVNNTISDSADPKLSAKIDEIKKILLAQQGDNADSAKLLAKYPLGYVIFDVENVSSVFPYKSHGLSRYDFDWSPVSVVEDRPDHLLIKMPGIREKLNGNSFTGGSIGTAKKIGPVFTNFFTDEVVTVKEEILAIRDNGIILLIGFANATPPKK